MSLLYQCDEANSSVYGLDDEGSGFDSRQGKEIFLSSTVSRLVLEAIQPSVQWVTGTFPMRVKEPGREAYYSPPCCGKGKNVWKYASKGFMRRYIA
jgi:hypothetical protein